MTETISFQLGDHLFRESYGEVVALLSSKFGKEYLDLIENSVQESLISAVKNWPLSGRPKNPKGWLYKVAQNRLIDYLRKEKRNAAFKGEMAALPYDIHSALNVGGNDLLKLLFLTCHPSLKEEDQVALTLKLVCGFSLKELANVFMLKEKTIEQRVVRAKTKIKDSKVSFEISSDQPVQKRLKPVLNCIYSLFNHGYLNLESHELLTEEVCKEALRINEILLRDTRFESAKGQALNALFLFQLSRFKARTNSSCLLYTSPSPRDATLSRMPSSA